jgi:hypothetical protein
MNKRYQLLLPLVFVCLYSLQSQDSAAPVIAPIQQFFDGMRTSDTSLIKQTLYPGVSLKTVAATKEGTFELKDGDMDDFLNAVGTPHDKVFDERILSYDVKLDGPMASVWTPYRFYLGEEFSHCGVNVFQMIQTPEGWKIASIMDTRRRKGCDSEVPDHESAINELLDNWHKAAATADADVFFGSMAEHGIYLGTDASERWLRDELRSWAKSAFEREVAWAFTPSDRHIYFSADKQTAWFEERLDTWMGVCRGSGVLEYLDGEWKLVHYDLAIMVPNEKVEAFRELMKE